MTTVVDVAAWVGGRAITVDEVDARLATLRGGAFGTRLPGAHTAEGRNARRWVVQLLCAEQVVRQELAARGRVVAGGAQPMRLERALALGGVAAAVLASVPEIVELTGSYDVPLDEATIQAYYDRNSDLYAERGIAFDAARDPITQELRSVAADRAFGEWLEGRMSRDVVLAPGFEHPAEPGHPDSTHHH